MRRFSMGIVAMVFLLMVTNGCDIEPSSSDRQRDAQERLVNEGVSQIGLPSIKNFRELRLAKDIYEMRDQHGLITYSYLWSDIGGKLVFFCHSIGYPLPYAAQFTGPESMQRWFIPKTTNRVREYGTARLPQADPNGLFLPTAAEGSWVMCKDPKGKDARPVYVEPRVIVSPFPLVE